MIAPSVSPILLPPDNVGPNGTSCARHTVDWTVNGTIRTTTSAQMTNPVVSTLGLTFINQLIGKSWTWSSGPDTTNTHYGFLYEDLVKVVPQGFGGIYAAQSTTYTTVGPTPTPVETVIPGYAGVCDVELIQPLVTAVQQLSAAVTQLQAQVAALQSA